MIPSWFNISLTSDKISSFASEFLHSQEGKGKFCLIMQKEDSHLFSINVILQEKLTNNMSLWPRRREALGFWVFFILNHHRVNYLIAIMLKDSIPGIYHEKNYFVSAGTI